MNGNVAQDPNAIYDDKYPYWEANERKTEWMKWNTPKYRTKHNSNNTNTAVSSHRHLEHWASVYTAKGRWCNDGEPTKFDENTEDEENIFAHMFPLNQNFMPRCEIENSFLLICAEALEPSPQRLYISVRPICLHVCYSLLIEIKSEKKVCRRRVKVWELLTFTKSSAIWYGEFSIKIYRLRLVIKLVKCSSYVVLNASASMFASSHSPSTIYCKPLKNIPKGMKEKKNTRNKSNSSYGSDWSIGQNSILGKLVDYRSVRYFHLVHLVNAIYRGSSFDSVRFGRLFIESYSNRPVATFACHFSPRPVSWTHFHFCAEFLFLNRLNLITRSKRF